jgi:hypothetical protein
VLPNDVIGSLRDWESRFPVDSWKLRGIHVWPLLRIILGFRVHALQQGWVDPRGDRRTVAQKSGQALGNTISRLRDLRSSLCRISKADVVFLSYPTNRQLLGRTWNDRFFDPLADIVREQNRTSLLLEYRRDRTVYRAPRHRPAVLLRGAVERADRARRRRPSFANERFEGYEDLRKTVSDQFSGSAIQVKVPTVRALSGSLQWIEGIAGFLERLLERVAPKIVLCSCYYSYVGMALCLACRRRGMPIVDVQHGVTLRNPAYEGWTRFPHEGFALLPDIFWCWTERDSRPVAGWPESVRRHHRTLVGGNPSAAFWEGKDALAGEFRRRIAAIKGDSLNVLVTLSWASGLSDAYKELLRASPDHWTWWIRLHPTMGPERRPIRQWCEDNVKVAVHVDDPTVLPLPLLLKEASAHLTHNSTVIQDAAAAGLASVAIDRRAEQMYPDELSSGWMCLAEGVEETLAALVEQSRNATSLPRGIAYPSREQMAGVLLELLR